MQNGVEQKRKNRARSFKTQFASLVTNVRKHLKEKVSSSKKGEGGGKVASLKEKKANKRRQTKGLVASQRGTFEYGKGDKSFRNSMVHQGLQKERRHRKGYDHVHCTYWETSENFLLTVDLFRRLR